MTEVVLIGGRGDGRRVRLGVTQPVVEYAVGADHPARVWLDRYVSRRYVVHGWPIPGWEMRVSDDVTRAAEDQDVWFTARVWATDARHEQIARHCEHVLNRALLYAEDARRYGATGLELDGVLDQVVRPAIAELVALTTPGYDRERVAA